MIRNTGLNHPENHLILKIQIPTIGGWQRATLQSVFDMSKSDQKFSLNRMRSPVFVTLG